MMLNIFILLYLLGNLVFTAAADFDNIAWCEAYYVWQNLSFGSVFGWGTIYSFGNQELKKRVVWIFLFSIIMFLWNLGRLFADISVNDSRAVMACFLFVIGIISYLTFRPESRVAKFLNKHLLKQDYVQ